MKEAKFSRCYFGHLCFYYIPGVFAIPVSAIIDTTGFSICFGFWGFNWTWKKGLMG